MFIALLWPPRLSELLESATSLRRANRSADDRTLLGGFVVSELGTLTTAPDVCKLTRLLGHFRRSRRKRVF